MPIRVECSRCRDVTHFADNDAGLAVACLACGQHLRVPALAAKAPAATPAVSTDPAHQPLALPDDRPAPVPPPPPAEATPRRPIQPARPRSRWRAYTLLVVLLSCAGAVAALVYRNGSKRPASAVAQNGGAPTAVASSQPLTRPAPVAIVATAPVRPSSSPAAPPPATVPAPVVAAAPAVPAPIARTYTPLAAPVGFIGFDRVELSGRIQVDSYDAAAGPYGADSARTTALLLSNGPIHLSGEGYVRGAIHSADGVPVKVPKRLEITGSTDPLAVRLPAPPVALDPFAQDSANAALPGEYYKGGNLSIWGAHNVTLPAGVYYLNDVNIDSPATLRLEGPVTLLISGRLSLAGSIETAGNRPAHCRIRVTGDKPVSIVHKNRLFLDLYAPLSPVDVSGKGDLFGSIVGRSLRVSGTRTLHFDEALLPR